jgi:hypothetical protein
VGSSLFESHYNAVGSCDWTLITAGPLFDFIDDIIDGGGFPGLPELSKGIYKYGTASAICVSNDGFLDVKYGGVVTSAYFAVERYSPNTI